jgi:hypothetical protein
MGEEVHRINGIEERTRKVEDAIIRFEYIADTILVQVEKRLCALEKHDDEITKILYSTYDIKTKEADEKVAVMALSIRDQYDKYFLWSMMISSALFFMMVGFVAYDQGQKADIGTALEERAVASRDNKIRVEVIHTTLDKIDDKLDHISDRQAALITKYVK